MCSRNYTTTCVLRWKQNWMIPGHPLVRFFENTYNLFGDTLENSNEKSLEDFSDTKKINKKKQ